MRVHLREWMDDSTMNMWLTGCHGKCTGGLIKYKVVLILDRTDHERRSFSTVTF